MFKIDLRKERIEWIDIAKGFAIVLVVWGHTYPPIIRNNFDIALWLWSFIYNFHMPLFFCLSGYLYYLNLDRYEDKLNFIKNKFKFLIIPYIMFSVMSYAFINLCFNVTRLAKILTKAGYHSTDLKNTVLQILACQDHIDKHLWFIYCLFLIYILVKIFNFINIKAFILIAFVIGFAAQLLHFHDPDIISRTAKFLFYFSLSGLISISYIRNLSALKKWCIIISFIIVNIFKIYTDGIINNDLLTVALGYVTAISGILTTIIISLFIKDRLLKKIFILLGRYSYDIYLIHQPFIVSGVIGVLITYSKLPVFLICLITLLLGIIIPLLISKFIIRKSKILGSLLLGINQRTLGG